MADYMGSAMAWVSILLFFFAVGIIFMFCTPLYDQFVNVIGVNAGADPSTLAVLRDAWHIYCPVVAVLGICVYSWRKSSNRVG
jgi:hypothetical protein